MSRAAIRLIVALLIMLSLPSETFSLTIAMCTEIWSDPAQCGTACPLPELSTCKLREVISGVLRKQGYGPRSPFKLDYDSGSLTLDGYDPDRKVGFILLAGNPWCKEYQNRSFSEAPKNFLPPRRGAGIPLAPGAVPTREVTESWVRDRELQAQWEDEMKGIHARARLYARIRSWWIADDWSASLRYKAKSIYEIEETERAKSAFDAFLADTLSHQESALRAKRHIPGGNVVVARAGSETSYVLVISLYDPRYFSFEEYDENNDFVRLNSLVRQFENVSMQYLMQARALGLE